MHETVQNKLFFSVLGGNRTKLHNTEPFPDLHMQDMMPEGWIKMYMIYTNSYFGQHWAWHAWNTRLSPILHPKWVKLHFLPLQGTNWTHSYCTTHRTFTTHHLCHARHIYQCLRHLPQPWYADIGDYLTTFPCFIMSFLLVTCIILQEEQLVWSQNGHRSMAHAPY